MSGYLYAFFYLLGKSYKAEALDPCVYNYNWGHGEWIKQYRINPESLPSLVFGRVLLSQSLS